MKQRLKVFAMLWAALLLLMMAAHAVWMAVEPGYAWSDMSQAPAVIWHGLSMDLSMSAYFLFSSLF